MVKLLLQDNLWIWKFSRCDCKNKIHKNFIAVANNFCGYNNFTVNSCIHIYKIFIWNLPDGMYCERPETLECKRPLSSSATEGQSNVRIRTVYYFFYIAMWFCSGCWDTVDYFYSFSSLFTATRYPVVKHNAWTEKTLGTCMPSYMIHENKIKLWLELVAVKIKSLKSWYRLQPWKKCHATKFLHVRYWS